MESDEALKEHIDTFIDTHRAILDRDARGAWFVRPKRPACPICLGEDHAGACPCPEPEPAP